MVVVAVVTTELLTVESSGADDILDVWWLWMGEASSWVVGGCYRFVVVCHHGHQQQQFCFQWKVPGNKSKYRPFSLEMLGVTNADCFCK